MAPHGGFLRLESITINHSLVNQYGLTRSKTEYAVYYKHDADGYLILMVVTQVDNYIYSGTAAEMKSFESFLQKEFRIGELDRNNFEVMGCSISSSSNGSITLSQKEKLAEMTTDRLNELTKSRKGSETALPKYITAFK